jgi:hypothetical protein
MVFRQLLGDPQSQLMRHGFLGEIHLSQRLNQAIMNQQSIEILDLLMMRIRRLKLNHPAFFSVPHSDSDAFF